MLLEAYNQYLQTLVLNIGVLMLLTPEGKCRLLDLHLRHLADWTSRSH